MPRYVLGLTTVGDNYSYFSCPGTTFITVQVFNNAVDVGYGHGSSPNLGAGMYPPADEYLALQTATLPRHCDEVRFKNHIPGSVAQIQITAQGTEDLPTDLPLSVGISDNLVVINPDGTTGAAFTGVVSALGVTLPQGAVASPGSGADPILGNPGVGDWPQNSVQWTPNGQPNTVSTPSQSYLFGYTGQADSGHGGGLYNALQIGAQADGSHIGSAIGVIAGGANGSQQAGIAAYQHSNGSGEVDAWTANGAKKAVLLDVNGNSSFPGTVNGANLQTPGGINASGTIYTPGTVQSGQVLVGGSGLTSTNGAIYVSGADIHNTATRYIYTGNSQAYLYSDGTGGQCVGQAPAGVGVPACYVYVNNCVGSLPGYTGNTYPVLGSNYGGVYFAVGGYYASYIDTTGTYHVQSDETKKHNIKPIDHSEHLAKIEKLHLSEWEHERNPGILRTGPTAQEFAKVFGYGAYDPNGDKPENEPLIATHDVASSALAGVQALIAEVKKLTARVVELETQLAS